jgi:Tfp pilus assembly protein PilZ
MERRRHPRFIKRLETKISVGNTHFWSISSDLSESGLFIRTNRSCNVNTPVNIELSLPGNRVSFLKGIARRAVRTPFFTMRDGIGIEIIEKDRTFTNFVRSLIEESEENAAEQYLPELQVVDSLDCGGANKNQYDIIHEKRQQRRVNVEDMEVNCEMPLASYVKIINISETGLLVKADRKLDIGKEYAVKIGCEDEVLFVKAVVVWSLLDDNAENASGNIIAVYMAGMQFTNVLKGEITQIISLIEAHINTYCYVSTL